MLDFRALALAGAAWLALGSTSFADVQLSINNGQVTLVAKDATVRQILTEWAKVGRTTILNVERIPGGPISLELTNVSEQQALDLILRSVSGYIAAPRPSTVSDASQFDRIIVMPTAVAPRTPTAVAPPPPAFNQVAIQPPSVNEDDSEDIRPTPTFGGPQRNPIFATFPQPQVVNPQQPSFPSTMPGVIPMPPQNPQQVQPQIGGPPITSGPTVVPGAQPGGGASQPGVIVQPQQQPGNGQRVIVVPQSQQRVPNQ